jgi:phosphate transport system substrate-binding protein
MKNLKIYLISALLMLSMGIAAHADTMVKVDGSSTVYPITEGIAEDFQKAEGGKVKVTVGISGTGGGFKKFCKGEIDISDASRPIKPSEVELCKDNAIKYIELPVAFDGLTVVINPKNTWASSMTVSELKKIWEPSAQGKITKWSQVRAGWPDKPINLYGAGVDSGTYDYFTDAIVKKEHSSRGDFTSSEDDNVLVQGVANDVNALGFFGYAYYLENKNKLKAVAIDNEKGVGPVLPTHESVLSGKYQPLSRPIFIYASVKSLDKPEVLNFVNFYLKNAESISNEVGYVALPKNIYTAALKKVEMRKTGSVFGGKGSTVGVKVEDLVK